MNTSTSYHAEICAELRIALECFFDAWEKNNDLKEIESWRAKVITLTHQLEKLEKAA